MSCRNCASRLSLLMQRLGYTKAYQGWWERRSKYGYVVLDLKPRYHFRAALVALAIKVLA